MVRIQAQRTANNSMEKVVVQFRRYNKIVRDISTSASRTQK